MGGAHLGHARSRGGAGGGGGGGKGAHWSGSIGVRYNLMVMQVYADPGKLGECVAQCTFVQLRWSVSMIGLGGRQEVGVNSATCSPATIQTVVHGFHGEDPQSSEMSCIKG